MDQLEFVKRYNDLACLFLSRIVEAEPEENIVFSPFSILSLLNILADATGGSTRKEVLELLYGGLPQRGFPEQLKNAREELKKKENGGNDFGPGSGLIEDLSTHLHTANLVCVREEIRDAIRPDFQKHLKDMYEGILFSSPELEEALASVAVEMTGEGARPLVEEIVRSGSLLAMGNTVSFDAMWRVPYEDRNIKREAFHNADGTIGKVNMLYRGGGDYVENSLAIGFLKDFQQCDYSFMALLPRKKGTEAMKDVIRSVKFYQMMDDWEDVILHTKMPEFSFSFKTILNQMINTWGIREAFTAHADFSGMSSAPLMAETMIHQAKIEVNRNGASASAATYMILCGARPLEEVRNVMIDRPFLFAIMHKGLKIPVFVGVVNYAGDRTETLPGMAHEGGT